MSDAYRGPLKGLSDACDEGALAGDFDPWIPRISLDFGSGHVEDYYSWGSAEEGGRRYGEPEKILVSATHEDLTFEISIQWSRDDQRAELVSRGIDPQRVGRAFNAARTALTRELPEAGSPPPPPTLWSRFVAWVEAHPGNAAFIVGILGVVATVVTALIA